MVRVETRQKRAAGATKEAEIKGKIVEFLWYLKKQGYARSTVDLSIRMLKILIRYGADLLNPESVKKILAEHDEWSNAYKINFVTIYQRFADMLNIRFEPPLYRVVERLPFIPTEKEIDQLIAGCGKKTTIFLQLLRETGMRCGEAWKLKWIDIDTEKGTVRVTAEKHGKPRLLKISNKMIAMLNRLPKRSPLVFGGTNLNTFRSNFCHQRKRIAFKLENPRIQQISFHTLRHWKATMLYSKTKDILKVKQMLGHRNINSTMIYTHLINFDANDYISRITKTVKGARSLVEAGFEYVTDVDGYKLFRKPK